MKIIYGIILFLFCQVTHAAKGQDFQVVARANYNIATFALNSSSDASYTGIGYGGEIVNKYSNGRYGLGLVAGFSTVDLKNTANTSVESEKLTGYVLNLGTRFYALDFYLGAGVGFRSFDADYKLRAASTQTAYSGLGFRLEAGIDLPMGKTLIFAPKIHYDIQGVSPKNGAASSKRFKDFGLGIGLGLEF